MHHKGVLEVLYFSILAIEVAYCYSCDDPGLPVEDDFYVIENIKTYIENDDHVFATTPPGFSIRQSGIPNAGLGVFAETTIPKETRIGPYDGLVYYNKAPVSAYVWTVTYETSIVKHYVDALPKDSSSWLRYVNCPRTVDEENLYLFQYKYGKYYVTYECIQPGTELLVWYGEKYGQTLGLKRETNDYIRRFNETTAKFVRTDL